MTDIASPTQTTSMLVTQARDLSAKITRIASLDQEAELHAQFRKVGEAMKCHTERTAELLKSLTILHAHGLIRTNPFDRTKFASLEKKIDLLQKRLNDSRSQLVKGNTWASCDTEAGEMVKQLERSLMLIWGQFVADQTRNTEGLQPFRHVGDCGSILTLLDGLTRTLNDSKRDLPRADADVTTVLSASAEMDKLIAQLDLGDVPSAVQEFLKKATQGGISMSELTDEVLTCLRAKNFVQSLRVTSGPSGGR